MSTLPLGSRVAVWPVRAPDIGPVGAQVLGKLTPEVESGAAEADGDATKAARTAKDATKTRN
jgi:hypothetical protein